MAFNISPFQFTEAVEGADSIYNYTAEGGIQYSGAAIVEPLDDLFIPSGGIRFSGTATVTTVKVKLYNFFPAGGIKYSGQATNKFKFTVFNPTGGMKYSGAATTKYIAPYYAPTGGIKYSGEALIRGVSQHALEASGGISYSGNAIVVSGFSYKANGGVRFGGAANVEVKQPVFKASGGIEFSGKAASVFILAGREPTPENPYGDVFTGWAINYETNAASRYENLPINSICTFKGRVLVANEGGIYELGSDSDAGQPIMASIVIAKTDFGIRENKRVPYVYLGYQSEDNLRISVYTNKKSVAYYDAERPTEGSRGSRATLGRGLDGLYWSFRISNMNGAYFELDTIKIEPTILRKMGV